MALIQIPSKTAVQPLPNAVIDFGNPLAVGLISARTGSQTILGGYGSRGRFMGSPGSQGVVDPNIISSTSASSGSMTGLNTVTMVSVVRRVLSNNSNSNYAIRYRRTDNVNSTTMGLGTNAFTSNAQIQFTGPTNTTSFTTSNATSTPDNLFIAGSWDKTNNVQTLYLNGLSVATGAAGANAITAGSASVTMSMFDCDSSGGGTNTGLQPYVTLVYNRVLSDAEIRSLYENPWQVFKSPTRKLWATATSIIDLVVSGSSQLNASNGVIATQDHSITGASSSQSNSSLSTAITQDQALVADNSTQVSASLAAGITQDQALVVSGDSQLNNSLSVLITQDHLIVTIGSSQLNGSLSVVVAEDHNLAPTETSQSTASSLVTITQDQNLLPSACEQVNNSSTPSIAGTSELVVDGAVQGNISDSIVITQDQFVSVASVSQDNVCSFVSVEVTHNIVVDGSIQSSASLLTNITQDQSLVASGSLQNNLSSGTAIVLGASIGTVKVAVNYSPYYVYVSKSL